MSSLRLLNHALSKQPERVLDIGVGDGRQAITFISYGASVVGIDVKEAPFQHEQYRHHEGAIELIEPDESERFDLVWCSGLLQLVPNVQALLVQMSQFLKEDGWLYIAVPSAPQDRFRAGHLTVWTPVHLIYNLVCAGWDCKQAQWYTEYDTIGLCVPNQRIEDMSWRRPDESELVELNNYTPFNLRHEWGAWVANDWPTETSGRVIDPPLVTAGVVDTNLPPTTQLAYGPNPELRKGYENYGKH